MKESVKFSRNPAHSIWHGLHRNITRATITNVSALSATKSGALNVRYLDCPGAFARHRAQRIAPFGCRTRRCLYVRGRWLIGRSGDRTAIPSASNLGERNHFDRDGGSGWGSDRDGVHPPNASFDDLYGSCGRGLGVGGI
jgi:hypothetical protein